MKTYFANLSIQHKLLTIILTVTILTISIGFGIGIGIDIRNSKLELIEHSQITADLISEYCVSPLTFIDKEGAQEILAKSKTISYLMNAHLFDEHHQLFASYDRVPFPIRTPKATISHYFDQQGLHIYHPIYYQDNFYGTLYLRVSTHQLTNKVISYITHLSIVLVGLFLLAYILAYFLQKFISVPILALAKTSQDISVNADYSQQVTKFYTDETGQLVDAFNNMLTQIRYRENALFTETERLQVTLKSIGDAVVTTDKEGNIEYLNPIAEKLTGWHNVDAYQQPIKIVLNIISELTYQPVENPVERCLQSGDIIGLANHTLLIHKNGQEIAIEDSAAPIRNNNNDIIGAIMVFHDVSEARAMERELLSQTDSLLQAKEAAEQANQEKSDFFARMSHELRTPLNAIIGYSELVIDDFKDDNKDASDIKKINQAGNHLLALINDILDFSKLSEGKIEIYPKQTSIKNIINDLLTIINPLLDKKNNKLEIVYADVLDDIFVDPMRLQQILLNIMSNANKFSENSTINLNIYHYAAREKAWVSFEIIDAGIGIAQENLSSLFQAFSQINNIAPGLQGGTGLGLVISKNLCQMMGGDIWVESELGQGSCFTVRLPMDTPYK